MATAPNPENYAERLTVAPKPAIHDKLSKRPGRIGMIGFGIVLVIGVIYSAYHLLTDLATVHSGSVMPYVLLGIALLVALGFEFVNGFHDTANAVATVIYTHSLSRTSPSSGPASGISSASSPPAAWSPSASSRLLPVELILQVGSKAGFAMVFALLVAAIIWNLGTWWFGLPASSSHTLDRFDHRRRYRQSTDVAENRHQRRRLGPSHQHRQVAVAVATRRLSSAPSCFST